MRKQMIIFWEGGGDYRMKYSKRTFFMLLNIIKKFIAKNIRKKSGFIFDIAKFIRNISILH